MKRCAYGCVRVLAGLLIGFAGPAVFGETVGVSYDFQSGTPSGTSLVGSAVVSSGQLVLTSALAGQMGSFIVGDFTGGRTIGTFHATYTMSIGGGSGADGLSFNFGAVPSGAFGESGFLTSHSLTVSFDTYNNSGEAPGVNIFVNGSLVGRDTTPAGFPAGFPRGVGFVDINYDAAGLDVSWSGKSLFTDFNVAAYGFTAAAGDQFGLGARTGGLTDVHSVDDLSITATVPSATTPLPGAATAGLALMGGLGLTRGRRRVIA